MILQLIELVVQGFLVRGGLPLSGLQAGFIGKPGKSQNFIFDIFLDWKVMEKDYRSCKVLEVCSTQAIKFLEFML